MTTSNGGWVVIFKLARLTNEFSVLFFFLYRRYSIYCPNLCEFTLLLFYKFTLSHANGQYCIIASIRTKVRVHSMKKKNAGCKNQLMSPFSLLFFWDHRSPVPEIMALLAVHFVQVKRIVGPNKGEEKRGTFCNCSSFFPVLFSFGIGSLPIFPKDYTVSCSVHFRGFCPDKLEIIRIVHQGCQQCYESCSSRIS